MFHTTDANEAKQVHAELGGYLLDLCKEPPRPADPLPHVYAICSRAEAMELGRDPQQLDALAPSFREIN